MTYDGNQYPPPAPQQGWQPPPAAYPPPPPGWQPPAQPPKGRKKWPWIVGTIVAVIVIAGIAGGNKKKTDPAASTKPPAAATGTTTAAPISTVSQTSASAPTASGVRADVTIGPITSGDFGTSQVAVTVLNHSSKRSNYIITVALDTADGKTQLDTALTAVDNLDPGQTANETAAFLTAKNVPAGAKVIITNVTRYAS